MVWGVLGYGARGPLILLDPDTVTSASYLSDIIDPTIQWIRQQENHSDLYFLHDRAPCHKTVPVSEYLATTGIPNRLTAPKSPELSPTEYVWSKTQWWVNEISQPRSLQELKKAVFDAWVLCTGTEEIQRYYHHCAKLASKCKEHAGKNFFHYDVRTVQLKD